MVLTTMLHLQTGISSDNLDKFNITDKMMKYDSLINPEIPKAIRDAQRAEKKKVADERQTKAVAEKKERDAKNDEADDRLQKLRNAVPGKKSRKTAIKNKTPEENPTDDESDNNEYIDESDEEPVVRKPVSKTTAKTRSKNKIK